MPRPRLQQASQPSSAAIQAGGVPAAARVGEGQAFRVAPGCMRSHSHTHTTPACLPVRCAVSKRVSGCYSLDGEREWKGPIRRSVPVVTFLDWGPLKRAGPVLDSHTGAGPFHSHSFSSLFSHCPALPSSVPILHYHTHTQCLHLDGQSGHSW
jgi:hypothetical protein